MLGWVDVCDTWMASSPSFEILYAPFYQYFAFKGRFKMEKHKKDTLRNQDFKENDIRCLKLTYFHFQMHFSCKGTCISVIWHCTALSILRQIRNQQKGQFG